MFLKVKLLGKGTPQDPYGVNLPTYVHVLGNVTQGYSLVHLDDSTHDLTEEDLADEPYEVTTHGKLYHDLSDATRKKLHHTFDERYSKSPGKFRVERP